MVLIFKYNVIMRTILISLVLLFMSVMGNAQSLTLKIGGIENAEGFLYVGIYSSEESFMKKPVYGFRVEVKDTLVTVRCLCHFCFSGCEWQWCVGYRLFWPSD